MPATADVDAPGKTRRRCSSPLGRLRGVLRGLRAVIILAVLISSKTLGAM